jgi:WD40 repeat protein
MTEAPFHLRQGPVLDDAVTAIGWSAGEALVGSAGGRVHRLNAEGGLAGSWQAHDGGVTRLAFKPGDAQTLASAGEDGRVVLWSGKDGQGARVLVEENDWVEHLDWTPDGEVLAAAARKTISLWRDGESLGMWYDARRRVLALAWAPDGRRLATAANKGLYLWQLGRDRDGNVEPVQLLTFPGAPVAVAWHPRGLALGVGTQDGFLQVWRPGGKGTKARQLTMRGYPAKVTCLAWHPRRLLIATAGGPDVVLWDVPAKSGAARGNPLRHHQATVTALAWSPDGRVLASGDRAGRLCLWDADGCALFAQMLGQEIAAISWQPQGHWLLVGDTDGQLYRLDPAGGATRSPAADPGAPRDP